MKNALVVHDVQCTANIVKFLFTTWCSNGGLFFFFWWSLSGLILTSALIIWKGLICITGSESPVVVVLSESMEPGFQRVSILVEYNFYLFIYLFLQFDCSKVLDVSWDIYFGPMQRHLQVVHLMQFIFDNDVSQSWCLLQFSALKMIKLSRMVVLCQSSMWGISSFGLK